MGPVALVILDGWGYSDKKTWNAVYAADPRMFSWLWQRYPHAIVQASGRAVGVPDGYVGNSEVGHLTIGTGRVVRQPLTVVNDAIDDGSFFSHKLLIDCLSRLSTHGSGRLHIIGLISDGGVHSHDAHLRALLKCASNFALKEIFIHTILDGRDAPQKSALSYVGAVRQAIQTYGSGGTARMVIASLAGRFYAMDRDENWERTARYAAMLAGGGPTQAIDPEAYIGSMYAQGITDEFVPPILLHERAAIHPGDGIILFNIRPDRMQQIAALLLHQPLPVRHRAMPADMAALAQSDFVISFVRYHEQFSNPVLFEREPIKNTLLEVLSNNGITSCSVSETEKYAHVTYFFNGGLDVVHEHETRIQIPSRSVTSYATVPCMSAPDITFAVCQSLEKSPSDFYVINYANADMVGHTGDFAATVKAIGCIDRQLHTLYEDIVRKRGGIMVITADHGNAEDKWDTQAEAFKTSHTRDAVPLIVTVPKDIYDISGITGLSQIAPLILHIFSVSVPPEMGSA